MSQRSTYDAVTVSGGLLPEALLERVGAQDPDLEGIKPTDYHLASGERLGEAMTRSWNRLLAVWERFTQRLDDDGAVTGPTRQEWLLPLFQELEYGQLQVAPGFEIEGKPYSVSHLWESVPIHLVGAGVELDRRSAGVPGAARVSPHGLMQELLNRSIEFQWGIVSNGRRLRLIRDNASLTRAAFVEFDLEEVFAGNSYSDFVALWLTCHSSRLEGPSGKQLIERWREDSLREGVRALDELRQGVETAIQGLGAAAVGHPSNQPLRAKLEERKLDAQELYRQLLRVVYRLLFLLVTESRGLLLDPSANPTARQRYERYYSITRLRNLAEETKGANHTDLWRQLQVVSSALESKGEPALALHPLGGFLWASESTSALNDLEIPNSALLDAIRSLTRVQLRGGVAQRVDYANLGAEELGSIYEALLEYAPRVNPVAATFELVGVAGNERKTTGSYYTPTSLIEQLLNTALDPVLDEAANSAEPEQAILNLKVVDPAAGSGHFLIAAAHRMADRLARIRTDGNEPSPEQRQEAVRDVIGRCIYAVDMNPMAVELAKVAMWIEAMEPGKPLTFLDHHIVCGNGIIGATPAMIARGIPDDAFLAKDNEGDDRAACATHKKRNAAAREGQGNLLAGLSDWTPADRSADAQRVAALPDKTLAELTSKVRAWTSISTSQDLQYEKSLGDAYCAALTFPRTPESATWLVAPYDTFYTLREDRKATPTEAGGKPIDEENSRYRFFHWHIAFPDVFSPRPRPRDEDDRCGWDGGFDVVLGNPPWETLSPDRKEYFKSWLPGIASLSSKDQEAAIKAALEADPALSHQWDEHRRRLFATSRFFRRSGRYRMFAPGNLGKGDLNVYRAFVELALTSLGAGGVASQVTPSGIYAGANNAAIRAALLGDFVLRALWGFDNSEKSWFPDVGLKAFAIYSAERGAPTHEFDSAFGIKNPSDLATAVDKPFRYPVSMIRSIDEEALLIPEVDPGLDAHVMSKLISGRQTFGEQNRKRGWHPYRAEIHMGNDADLFTKDPNGIPVYEGRMVDFYDHRAKAYISGAGRSSKWSDPIPFDSPDKRIAPQWYILEKDLPAKLERSWTRYRIGFLDVANPKSDPRCLAAAIIPRGSVCGDKVPTISFEGGTEWRYAIWLATANSLVLDYLARKRIALKMSFTVMDGLPLPEMEPRSQLGTQIIDRVLRLTCVSPEMEQFRLDVLTSAHLPPSIAQVAATHLNERRALRADLDALIAHHCFELARDEFEHVLDSFAKLREREERPPTGKKPGYGEFRTKRLALEAFDRLDAPTWR